MAERGGRRRSRRDVSTRGRIPQLPWRSIVNPYRPIEVLSEDHLEAIHEAALTILEQIGIVFLLDEAVDRLAAAGAEVDRGSRTVRMAPTSSDRPWPPPRPGSICTRGTPGDASLSVPTTV